MRTARGFTLIELMVVVSIIALLFFVALPSYQSSMLRAHRSDAQSILMDISAREEKFVAQNNTYTTEISAATGLNLGSVNSKNGYYSLAVSACGGGTIASCYLITATATGGQVNDTDCTTITLSSAGVKSGSTANCWK